MITINNYFEKVKEIKFSTLSLKLKRGYAYLKEATENYTNWDHYYEYKEIKQTVNDYLTALNSFLNSTSGTKAPENKKMVAPVKPSLIERLKNRVKDHPKPTQLVERIDEEVKFIKRYAMMNGKEKTDMQLLNFINALQKSILDKRIRVHSIYKAEILYIQTALVNLYNELQKIGNPRKRIAEIEINKKVLDSFNTIAGSEKIRLSVNYLKRYIGIQGKSLTKEKATRLLALIKQAVEKRKIIANDPYAERLQIIYNSLHKFVKVSNKTDTLKVHPGILHGINDCLEGIDIDEQELGCDCEKKKDSSLNGIEPVIEEETEEEVNPIPEQQIMSSTDLSKMSFPTIGFTGKWLKLIGDPSPGFSAMIFGKPKMGKSYLAIEFAGYLAKFHGPTLYVAREEGLSKTLQDKIDATKAAHPDLFTSDYLPEDLSPYQHTVIDSINSLNLNPSDLTELKSKNRGRSIIEVHQVTKAGKHRGSMEHQHNVDVIIEIPEVGKAVQFGRFNQGGEMDFFEDKDNGQAA